MCNNDYTPPEALDRRQRRTRRRLHEAMRELLAEKDFAGLTVGEIADRVDIARKTFYLHYPDKETLLWASLESLFDELAAEVSALDAATLLADGKPLTYPVFAHVKAHAGLYRVLLAENGPAGFIPRFMAYMTRQSYERHAPLRAMAPRITVEPQFTARFLAGALVNVLVWWLDDDDLATPPETVAYRFSQLAAPGVLGALGLDG
jgi:AcrR family transcriptional regulator